MTDYFVYVLKSKISNHYYVGQTDDLERRVMEHNLKKVFWTKRYTPWILVYTEKYLSREQAILKEKYYKSHAGRNSLKKLRL